MASNGINLAKVIEMRKRKPATMRDDELDQYADNYEANYGVNSTKDRPGFMRVFDSSDKRVFLGDRDGKQFFRPSNEASNAFTPELPETAQQMAMVLAERNRRRRVVK